MLHNLRHRIRQQISGDSLRARVVQSGLVVLAAEGYSNLLRLASNLIMTRLLYPEAFGLMLIVNLVAMVLDQLSDVGVKAALIAKPGEITQGYLNTAWTMLFIRNGLLAIITAALAHPIAAFYGEPELAGLLMLIALIPVVNAFESPNGMLFEKRVEVARVIFSNVVTSTASVAIVLVWMLISPSVWALAANGLIAAVIAAVLSYFVFPGRRPQLFWDSALAKELFHFGRWVFLATALTFLVRQGDSLVVSKAATTEQLGTFSIAVALARLLEQIVGRLNWNVMFPAYAELNRLQSSAEEITGRRRRVKLALFALSAPIVLAFAVGGQLLIDLLYDPRYRDSGWILQILGAGTLFVALGSPFRTLTMSLGDSYRYMWQQVLSVTLIVVSMLAGNALGGFEGLIVGIAFAQFLEYLVVRWAVRPYANDSFKLDYVFAIAIAITIAACWASFGLPWETRL